VRSSKKCCVGDERVIGVVIADDHPIYRSGLAHEIASHPWLELVGEAADGREALALIRALRPQVAVLDLRMPGLSGDRLAEAIAALDQGTTILVLSAFDDQQGIFDAVAAGASGYVLKDADRDVICDAIVCVAGGGRVLPPQLQDRLLRELRNRSARGDSRLSSREHEVLELAARGMSTPQIGRSLYIGASTVKTHLERIADKLGVHGRTAAVAEAMRRGLLD
jgi:two-component system, NarL family, nitrate/nitrite response regulator NarL